jgi:hypothetical protein
MGIIAKAKERLFGSPGEAASGRYIANVLSNRQLYQRAYLIEFYGDDENTPEEAFTFSLPPESEELTYTQRKTETKTFGGLHVDEYGIDAVKIALSGSTVNQSLKRIYRGIQSSMWLSGEEEIYYLRDLIQKYRSLESLQKKTKGKIMLYDLSKTYRNRGQKRVRTIHNYWQAFPGDFKISRSADRPFTYKYAFEFTGIPIEDFGAYKSHGEPPALNEGKLGLIPSLMNKLITVLAFVDGINGWVNNVLAHVNQVSKLLKVLGNVMSYAANAVTGVMDAIGDSASGLVDGATSVVAGVNALISLPRAVQLQALNIGLEMQNATNGLMRATADLVKECRDMFAEEYWRIPQEVLDQYAMNNEEFKDSISILLDEAENTANELAAAAKSSSIPDVTTGNPTSGNGSVGNSGSSQTIVLSYGYILAILTSADTLESLAKQYLGDPGRAIDIATYNGIASLSDEGGSSPGSNQKTTLKPGDRIKIPLTTPAKQILANRIFARREDRDNYGRDMALDDDGRIIASASGDYALTSGAETLSQAILLRLRENVAKRIRLNAYGIRTAISDQTAGIVYLISSIEQTVKADPRISSVDDIRFTGRGDFLDVTIDYTDINNMNGNAAGRV